MTFSDLEALISTLKEIKGVTLKEYINSLAEEYYKSQNSAYRIIIDELFNLEDFSLDSFTGMLLKKLFSNTSGEEESIEKIQELLEISMEQYTLWYEYIQEENQGRLIYHTYHGTKGLEYDNVVIIMGKTFGTDKDYLSFYFRKLIDNEQLDEEEEVKFRQLKNLLYVSVTRAIRNLRILYIDDIIDIQNGIESIFGKINKYGIDSLY